MESNGKKNLIDLTPDDIRQLMERWGEPPYRATQLIAWLYKRGVHSFTQMNNLPNGLRQKLDNQWILFLPQVIKEQVARDGTRKYLLKMADGETVEAVVIGEAERLTACISSQVGCAIGCSFCATGRSGFTRQLTSGEIVGQVLVLQEKNNTVFTNIVCMGMGEPLANYDNVITAIRTINHPDGLGLGARRITLSTAGVVPGIRRLAHEALQINLAVSLHAPNDYLRNQLVPLNRTYSIRDLLNACRYYIDHTNRRITFEYVLLRAVNDSTAIAHELGRLLAGMLCHVNLIPVNPAGSKEDIRPSEEDTRAFARILLCYGVQTTLRKEKGTDIAAACGQLRQRRSTPG